MNIENFKYLFIICGVILMILLTFDFSIKENNKDLIKSFKKKSKVFVLQTKEIRLIDSVKTIDDKSYFFVQGRGYTFGQLKIIDK
ncbi:hypothetical protein QG516_03985 [Pedobacter gandavensis]|uniref:hypothetical protein n=1 Tax=Pedobacter gandavensis TaxID=2679963 RepID=UPI002479EE58|nr:hypothetical protein [Pedobacter gandavensis]WGQ10813.1 hypothetical protein QG516_03985 [Pedobacter gandavensis]